MSGKLRYRADKSHRRLGIAAAAFLAGAAIPIAAAGTAWADDDTITLAQAEKDAKAGEAVAISINGTTHCYNCTGDANAPVADSGTKGEDNTAIAIGNGSMATDDTGDKHDTAAASATSATGGTGGTAEVDYAAASKATAVNGATAEINAVAAVNAPAGFATGDTKDTAVAAGAGTTADVELSNSSKAIATDTGSTPTDPTNGGGPGSAAGAYVTQANDGSAIASGTGSYAITELSDQSSATAKDGGTVWIQLGFDSSATATNTGSQGWASVYASTDSHATATNTGTGYAQVWQSADSTATATNTDGGYAAVTDADHSSAVAAGDKSIAQIWQEGSPGIIDSSAVDTKGESGETTVGTSYTHEVNGAVVSPHVEMTPLTPVDDVLATPLP